jgi:hypothetical protein
MIPRLLPRTVADGRESRWAWLLPEWQPIARGWFVTVTLLCAWLFLALLTDDDGYLLGLDGLNLVVHEAGHFLFVWFGETAELYGGTLLQLIVPAAFCLAFVRRREAPGFALAAVWLFQNFLNVARYVADARAQELPLVGGGGHDWNAILSRWHLLRYDTRLAAVVRAAGWIGMLSSYGWFVWRWLQDRAFSRSTREAR